MKLFKSISCGLLSALLLLGAVAPLTFTACDNEHPEINISLTSDMSGIVQAINDANNSLTMKLALIEAAIKEGNLQNQQAFDLIVKAIETLNGTLDQKLAAIEAAITSQTASLETKLALIEAAIKAGLIDSKTDLTLIEKALETLNGTLEDKLAAIEAAIASQTTSLETKLALIEAAIKSQTTSLETKLALIETAIKTGLADNKTALGEIKTALESLKGSVDGLDAAIDDVVAAIDKVVAAIGDTNTALKGDIATALADIIAAINGIPDYTAALEALKAAIEDLTVGPGYDFLHLSYYTFNATHKNAPFIQQLDFAANDGSVIWWTQVNPSYFTAASGDESFRHALHHYAPAPINLAELAFNVVDENDNIMSETAMAAAGLSAEFSTLGSTDYSSMWDATHTVFTYNSKEPFIRMRGKLFVTADGIKTPVTTRFSKPKASVAHPEEELDYSTFALVAWQPFKEMTLAKDTYTIELDENKLYAVALADVTGLTLKDNRPNGVSYYVFKENNWITGNVTSFDAEAGTYTTGGNGYISGVTSRQAYSITPEATATGASIPASLSGIIKGVRYSSDGVHFAYSQDSDGSLMPYFVVDYTSEVQFHGQVEIPVTITFKNPWQDVSATCTIVVKGCGEDTVSFATNSDAQSWATETDGTYGSGFTTTTQGLKIAYYKHTSTSSPVAPNANNVRVYKNSVLSISSTGTKKIKKIVIGTAPDSGSTSYCHDLDGLEGSADATCDKSALTVTWSGSASKVLLQSNEGQLRMEKLTVEFE